MSTTTKMEAPGRGRCRTRWSRWRGAAVTAAGTGALAVVAAVAVPQPAMADGPVRTVVPPAPSPLNPIIVSDLCSFPVTLDAIQGYTLLDFTDATGAGKQIYHVTETDTFTGPTGVSLTGVTYVYDLRAIWDAQGNALQVVGTGISVRVPLRNGSTFFAAGRIDFLKHQDDDFVAVPDHGTSRNLAEFCAELS